MNNSDRTLLRIFYRCIYLYIYPKDRLYLDTSLYLLSKISNIKFYHEDGSSFLNYHLY